LVCSIFSRGLRKLTSTLVKLRGFVANLHPAKDRARFGRGCLDSLGLEDIPICWGEQAHASSDTLQEIKEWEFPYGKPWFPENFSAKREMTFTPYGKNKKDPADHFEIESGVNFLERIIDETIAARKVDTSVPKLTFLLISGLGDIATIAKRQPRKLALATGNVSLQGDYRVEYGPHSDKAILTPDLVCMMRGFRFH